MKTNESLHEILNTLEQVRASHYPDIDKNILFEIVDIQYKNQEPGRRSIAKSETAKAVKAYIDEKL